VRENIYYAAHKCALTSVAGTRTFAHTDARTYTYAEQTVDANINIRGSD